MAMVVEVVVVQVSVLGDMEGGGGGVGGRGGGEGEEEGLRWLRWWWRREDSLVEN